MFKCRYFLLVVLFLLMGVEILLAQTQVPQPGSLVIIGGALSEDNATVYHRFIELGGGVNTIRIAIIPAGSIAPVESGQEYVSIFHKYGVATENIKVFPVAAVDDPSTPTVNEELWLTNGLKEDLAKDMNMFSAVFFVGGDQERYIRTLKTKNGEDTLLLKAIREVYQKGGVIGGTSAGAAMMSDPMIGGGDSITALLTGDVKITQGLGFFTAGLVDQHFIKRGRIGRLLAALLTLPHTNLGIGIDEDTAAIFHGSTQQLEVAGRSGILILDINHILPTERRLNGEIHHIMVHYLEEGDTYNLEKGTCTIHESRKKIAPGKEYYTSSPLETAVFGRDIVKEMITTGLADCTVTQAVGLGFSLDCTDKTKANGFAWTFSKGKDTVGYYGKCNDKETYSVVGVNLDVAPIWVSVERTKKH